MPDPDSIERQKNLYSKSLDKQLQDAKTSTSQQNLQYKQIIAAYQKKFKNESTYSIDTKCQQDLMNVDRQASIKLQQLQERAAQYKLALEKQASAVQLEYVEKKTQEELLMKQYEVQKQYYASQARVGQQYATPQGRTAGRTTSQTLPPTAVESQTMSQGALRPSGSQQVRKSASQSKRAK